MPPKLPPDTLSFGHRGDTRAAVKSGDSHSIVVSFSEANQDGRCAHRRVLDTTNNTMHGAAEGD